jgi:curved DNA-binding protein CbpA
VRRYYELLDISEDATPEQIEKAYKRMASKHHPDKNLGNETEAAERFKEIKTAYECLSDPERRAAYDESGDTSVEMGNPAEDLLMQLMNNIIDSFETMADCFAKCYQVLQNLTEECETRTKSTNGTIHRLERMSKNLRYKGKGFNLIEGILNDKLKTARQELEELAAAQNAAKLVIEILRDYEALDKRAGPKNFYGQFDRAEIEKAAAELRRVFGKGTRPGGYPFSGI